MSDAQTLIINGRRRRSVTFKVTHRSFSVILGADDSAPSKYLEPRAQYLSSDCFSLLLPGCGAERFFWNSMFWSVVRNTSNFVAASVNSFPFLIPPIRFLAQSRLRVRPGVNRAGEGRVHQAGFSSGSSAACASSSTATARSRLTDGKSSRKTSRGSPASR